MTTETTEEMNQFTSKSKTWMIVAILLALVGVALSVYSIKHHVDLKVNGVTDALCNINDKFSCDATAKSKYSEFFDVPLGTWGLGYFLSLITLCGLTLFKPSTFKDNMSAYLATVGIGLVTSIGLGTLSYVELGTFCPTCIGIYVVTLLQFLSLFAFKAQWPRGFTIQHVGNGGSTAALAVALVVLGFKTLLPAPVAKQPGQDSPVDLSMSSEKHEIPLNKSAYSGLGEDYRKGNDQAKVVLVEFADYECPACSTMAKVLKQIHEEFKNDLLVVFKNYPLDQKCNPNIQQKFHENACNIAVIARCAGNYGKFWPYFDAVFEAQKGITLDIAKNIAVQHGLTMQQIDTCLADKTILEKIGDDVSIATRLGISGTPTLFLNGRKVHSSDINSLRELIRKAIAEQ